LRIWSRSSASFRIESAPDIYNMPLTDNQFQKESKCSDPFH
jgi:hypothetical protein